MAPLLAGRRVPSLRWGSSQTGPGPVSSSAYSELGEGSPIRKKLPTPFSGRPVPRTCGGWPFGRNQRPAADLAAGQGFTQCRPKVRKATAEQGGEDGAEHGWT